MQTKDDQIEELKHLLEMEKMVKKSEVMRNADLKLYNSKLELSFSEVCKINEKFLDKIVKLQAIINKM
tara:strand:+ start:226 stop:429 length:204 start_codon:yes stop_codon:yes gene_type:complete